MSVVEMIIHSVALLGVPDKWNYFIAHSERTLCVVVCLCWHRQSRIPSNFVSENGQRDRHVAATGSKSC